MIPTSQDEKIKQLLLKAVACINNADWTSAYAILIQVLNPSPVKQQSQPGLYVQNAWLYMGITLVETGQYEEAILYLNKFLSHQNQHLTGRRFLAFALLCLGKYEQGFKALLYPSNGFEKRTFKMPLWDGNSHKNGTILVYDGPCNDKINGDYGDGFGDAIQFVRYVQLLKPHFTTILLQCHERLLPLFETLPYVDCVINRDNPVALADVRLPLIHLPAIFKTETNKIPFTEKYLDARKIAVKQGFKIGICWQGNTSHFAHLKRNIELKELLKLLDKKPVEIYNLQKDPDSEDTAHLALHNVVHLPERLKDFKETASLIASLDLVITVDTATAHLSGALGIPTWVLLPFAPDWRWQSKMLWYEKSKLFRQKSLGDWSHPLMQLEKALSALLKTGI